MKLTDLIKDSGIELGKVYTDKDKPPFQVNEGKVDQSFNRIIALLRKESRKLNDDDSYELSKKLKAWFKKNIYDSVNEDFGMSAKQVPNFSSGEAKKVIDDGLKLWAKDLRKVQYRIIKDWMSKAKSGVIDYFDIIRGIQYGDASRAHPNEVKFLHSLLNKDKIMNRFRQYFGGKKGKPRGK